MNDLLYQIYVLLEESPPCLRQDRMLNKRICALETQLRDLLPEQGKALVEEYARLECDFDTHSRENLFLQALALGIRLGALPMPGTPSLRL